MYLLVILRQKVYIATGNMNDKLLLNQISKLLAWLLYDLIIKSTQTATHVQTVL